MEVRLDDQGNFDGNASGELAIRAQADILLAHMRSRLIIRLSLYGLASLFVIVAALLVVFAPSGRETATAIVAFALFAVAIGAAGFGTFAIKTPLGSAEGGQQLAPISPPPGTATNLKVV
jgi:hypothetical protein